MNQTTQENITQLLLEVANGNETAVNSLLPVIYDELKKSRQIICGASASVILYSRRLWFTKHI